MGIDYLLCGVPCGVGIICVRCGFLAGFGVLGARWVSGVFGGFMVWILG